MPFLPPEPLHPLVIDRPALQSQASVDQPPAPEPMAPGEFPNSITDLLILNVGQWHGVSLSIVVLTRQVTGTTLGNPQPILQNHHGSASTFRA